MSGQHELSMKIAVFSDTHGTGPSFTLDWALPYLTTADAVLHAGDFTTPATLAFFRKFPGFHGVTGNGDQPEVAAVLPGQQILELAAYRVGLFHGHGPGKSTPERAYAAFADQPVDIIVFGHSHQPAIFTKNKILLLNPGSPTNKRKERWFSFILLELSPSRVAATLVFNTGKTTGSVEEY
ncbi:metallophosphoesterase family protein [Propionispora vibrioides]|uniref:Phosphoesterase n=1 Tax=Propionispora vibrioides TaxID=112903 RepID=A0A1H8R7Q5_9FIRM|nr:metallophosphoesterase [Propionispora vibrioides]SEO62649.1 hypothetical protein SAMN04490178_103198 [Propionispora vibrioides]